jgi:hypothetical protein
MNATTFLRHSTRVGCIAVLLVGTCGHAQTNRSVRQIGAAPAPSTSTATSGGTTLGMPNPSGLQSRFPAGLPSPLVNPAGLPDPTKPNVSVPGVAPGSPVVDPGVAQGYAPGGGAYVPGSNAPRVMAAGAPGSYTATQIAGSFIGADANRDGELTRTEAQRLTIAPRSFDEMDANHDGILTRSEYEDAFR